MKLFLLLYVPRSGSTFFASLVAKRFSQVLVIPELRLPKLLVTHDVENTADPRQTLIDLVKLDHQFPALKLSMTEVEQCIQRMEGGNIAESFLVQIALAVARKKNLQPEAVLYKCGSAGRCWPQLRQRMPGMGFIHIYRDPRAAVNSAMRTERPYHPGQKMGRGDPWFQARTWNAFNTRMSSLKHAGELVCEIKYEELCVAPDRVLREFAARLGLEQPAKDGAGLALSSREASIHRNVDRDAMPERSEAWQSEMPRWQGLVVEFLTGGQLRDRQYALFYSKRMMLPGRLARLGYGFFYHLVAMLYFHGRRRFVRATPRLPD